MTAFQDSPAVYLKLVDVAFGSNYSQSMSDSVEPNFGSCQIKYRVLEDVPNFFNALSRQLFYLLHPFSRLCSAW